MCYNHSWVPALMNAWQTASEAGGRSSSSLASDKEQKQWDMLLDFTKKQFSGTAAAQYTSSRENRDALREAILVRMEGMYCTPFCSLAPLPKLAASGAKAIYGSPHKRKPDEAPDEGGLNPGAERGDSEVLSADLLLMGIMASDVRLALRGFRDWCDALGVEFVLPENRVGSLDVLVCLFGQCMVHLCDPFSE